MTWRRGGLTVLIGAVCFGAWYAGDHILKKGLPPGIAVLGLVLCCAHAVWAIAAT